MRRHFLIICAVRHALLIVVLLPVMWITANGDRSTFQAPSARPNAFWCPMHPDIRSPDAGKCPICSMALVRIPASTHGAYELEATQIPRPGGKGTKALQIQIRHPETAEAVTAFSEIHERTLHLFIIGRDLSYFPHVHPDRKDSGFELPVDLDPGVYVLVADFAPSAGAPQLVQRVIVTPESVVSPFASADVTPDLTDKIVDGVRISLTADARAQRATALRFTLRDHASGAPPTDLEPYLGAAGHLLIVNSDITVAIHAHPEGSATAGPEVMFSPIFPSPGVYKLWVQFQRKGRVLTAPFAIAVR